VTEPVALEGWNVVQSKVVQGWIDMGEVMGELKGRVEAVLEVLEGRFGTLPADLAAAVRQIDDLPRLRRLATLAGQAPSLDRFRQDGGV
jgi:hypothetical protein